MRLKVITTTIGTALLLTACGAGTTTTVNNNATPTCYAPTFTNSDAIALLSNWGQGLQTYSAANNPSVFVSAGFFTMKYYTPDAVLVPTVSAINREGTQEIYDYFTGFLAINPIMSIPNPESNIAMPFDCGVGVYSGYYDFRTNPNTPQESTVHARFTFVYEYVPASFFESFVVESGPESGTSYTQQNAPGWYIYTQHSSALPNNH